MFTVHQNPTRESYKAASTAVDRLDVTLDGTSKRAAHLLSSLAPRLNRVVRTQVRPLAGLSLPQFIMLRALRLGPLSSGALAQRFGVSRPTITRTVDGLVKKNLIERLPDGRDRRVTMIALTGAGRDLHATTEATAERHLSALIEPLSAERIERLIGALADLIGVLDAAEGADGACLDSSSSSSASESFRSSLTRFVSTMVLR